MSSSILYAYYGFRISGLATLAMTFFFENLIYDPFMGHSDP